MQVFNNWQFYSVLSICEIASLWGFLTKYSDNYSNHQESLKLYKMNEIELVN